MQRQSSTRHSSGSSRDFMTLQRSVSTTASPRSKSDVRPTTPRSGSDSSSLHRTPSHRHNDYSCYIHVINKTGVKLELVDAKSTSGKWAHGGPPEEIEVDTDTLIELTDPRGPHGSEGWVSYRFHHPKRHNAVTFKLKFADPYWAVDDNYLRTSTQYSEWVSCNVLRYQTNGHPFIAYVEINALQVDQPEPHKDKKYADEVVSDEETHSENGDKRSRASSEQPPGYSPVVHPVSPPATPEKKKSQPLIEITPVEEEDENQHQSQGLGHGDADVDDDVVVVEKPIEESPVPEPTTEHPMTPVEEEPAKHVEEPADDPVKDIEGPVRETTEEPEKHVDEPIVAAPQDLTAESESKPVEDIEPKLEEGKTGEPAEKEAKEPIEKPKPIEIEAPVEKPEEPIEVNEPEPTPVPGHVKEPVEEPVHAPTLVEQPVGEPTSEPVKGTPEVTVEDHAPLPEPIKKPIGEPVKLTEPVSAPEPVRQLEPITAPVEEPVAAPESIKEPVEVQQPEPTTEPVHEPLKTPVKEQETEPSPAPESVPEPAKEVPEPVQVPELVDEKPVAPKPVTQSAPMKVDDDSTATVRYRGPYPIQQSWEKLPARAMVPHDERPALVPKPQGIPAVPVRADDLESDDCDEDEEDEYLKSREGDYASEGGPIPVIPSQPMIKSPSPLAVFLTKRGRLGIVALVFLASYGFTSAKVFGGLLDRLSIRRT